MWAQVVAGIAVMAPLFVILERLNPEVRRTKVHEEQRTDYAYVAAQIVWLPICGLILTTLVGAIARARLPIGDLSHVYGVQATCAFIVAELTAYWTHRIEHTLPILWRVHAVHHASRDVHWVTSFRFHPADVAIQQLAPPLVVAAVGFPIVSLAPYLIVVGVVTLFAHCNVSLPPTRLIVTPGYHRTHHETDRVANNFALTLPVMDIVFRTASFKRGTRKFGTAAPVPDRGFWSQFRWGLGLTKQEQTQ
jgi:sterol desaturase/sphingolipid hydroxylase (fatty acid hydroxylase superfamily)